MSDRRSDLLDQAIQREFTALENAQNNQQWRDAEIADHRRLALLALFDEFAAIERGEAFQAMADAAADKDAEHDSIAESFRPIIPTVTLSEAVRLAETTTEAIEHAEFHHETVGAVDRRKVPDNHVLELCEHVRKLAAALADAATEAECGHEMGGLAETILHRNGFRELREYVLTYGPEGDPLPF